MNKLLTSSIVFALIYVLLMVPTYLLPYFASNSSIVNVATVGLNPAFWLHLLAFFFLVVWAWVRGQYIDKNWLFVLPILAVIFDFIPLLSSIPFIPTIFHITALIIGVVSASSDKSKDDPRSVQI